MRLTRNRSISVALSGAFTRSAQSDGRSIGQGESSDRVRIVSVRPGPQAAPSPILSPLNHGWPHGIAFDIPADAEQMVILLNWKTLEPPLIDVAGARRMTMGMPSLHVRVREPAHEFSKLPILSRPDHQMPVVGHQTPELTKGVTTDLTHKRGHY